MTRTVRRALRAVLPATAFAFTTFAHAQGDPEVIKRIINEGKNNSRVWVYETYLSEEIGPRLTGSARLERANNWARDLFESFGCANAHLFPWGEIPVRFDRGPSYCKMTKPITKDFEFTARAWSAGTDGPLTGKVIKQPANMEELEAMREQLQGAWVLAKPTARGGRRGVMGDNPQAPPPPSNADAPAPPGNADVPATRPADDANAAPPPPREQGARDPSATDQPPREPGRDGAEAGQPPRDSASRDQAGDRPAPRERRPDPQQELIDALYEAGIAGRITPSSSDLVITGGERGWRDLEFDDLPSRVTITIRRADYDALNSRLADGEAIEIEANLQHHFTEGPIPVYNTIAEIPGAEFPEQVVIVSAHLDSWDGPGSQGAQDNGTGTSVTLETARILTAAGVKPRRTIRFCLWTGEEQGLLGSREYVKSLSDEEKANISAALVDDGGTNYQGGLVCVADMEAMLKAATEPVTKAFPDMPVDIIVRQRMPRGGGSDHASFNSAGIPGFFWEEDGVGGREGKNYTYVHHTQYDTTRFAVPEYLVQSATCSAVTAYNLAMADTLLPRYVPPATQPEQEDTSPFTPTPGPLTGTWIGAVIRDGQPSEFTFTYTFEHSAEGKMRGRMFSRYGEGALSSIVFNSDSGEITFKRDSEMGASTYKAKLRGEEMEGSIERDEGSFNMTFTAHRDALDIKPPTPPEERGGRDAAQGDDPRPRDGRSGEAGPGAGSNASGRNGN